MFWSLFASSQGGDGQGSTTLHIPDKLPDPATKEYTDLRDRAAYVYATGTFPTHLRTYFTSLLRAVTRYSRKPVSLDGRTGSMQVLPENIQALNLDQHPMVKKVRDYISKGYHIQVAQDVRARRPYSKVFLFKKEPGGHTDLVTVQVDGSIKDGWS